MIVHSAAHYIEPHDGVSGFMLLFQEHCRELGIENRIYAHDVHPSLEGRCLPSSELAFVQSPDDILIWHYADSPEVYLAERFPGRRVLFHHNVTPPQFFPEGSVHRTACENGIARLATVTTAFDLALGASEFTRQDLERRGFPRTGVFPLFSKVQSVDSIPDPALRQEITLITLCRVAPNKNIEESIAIVAALHQQAPTKLVVIGSMGQTPDYAEHLKAVARQHGLQPGHQFVLAGSLEEAEMREQLRNADGYLCTSLHEGFCLPLLEAMALGLPVFAVPRTAIEETMGGAGVLLPESDPRQAAERIRRTLIDASERQRVLAGQSLRLQDFTPHRDRERVDTLLKQITALPIRPSTWESVSVSVVICTWNRADHLRNTLEALRRLQHEKLEVLVVNGPSTDHTADVLADYQGQIKVLYNQTRNLSISRNIGIAAASGDFVAFLDDDAIAHPHWLREALPLFADSFTAGVGGATYRFTNEEPEFINGILRETGHPLAVQPFPGVHFDGSRGFYNTVRGNNCIFRATALRAVGGFDERFEYAHDEADLTMRLAQAGWRVRHAPLAIVHHSNQPSQNRRSEFDVNWRANLKNTIYCAVKNRPSGRSSLSFLVPVVTDNMRVRLRDAMDWWLQKRVSFQLFAKIVAGCTRGAAEGIAKSLRVKPQYAEFRTPSVPSDFLPYRLALVRTGTVAHLTQELPFRAPTGVGYSSIWLAKGLAELGYDNHLIARGDTRSRDARNGCHIHFSPDQLDGSATTLMEFPDAHRAFGRSLAAWHTLQELAVRDGLRFVFTPLWESEGLAAALDPRFLVIPIVITPIHEVCEIEGRPLVGSAAWLSDFERQLLQHATAIVGISHSSLRDVLAYHNVSTSLQRIIPHGLPDPLSTADPVRSAPFQRTPPPQRVLFIGPASARKGTPELLAAIPLILQRCPDAEFDIAGNLPKDPQSIEARWVEAFRTAHPVAAARTRFLGRITDERKHQLYQQARVLVMPSRYESFGIPAAEAQAYGLPIVAANVGGLPEVVAADETALVIPREDPQALAEATVRLLLDDALWGSMSTYARARYDERFTIKGMATAYSDLLQDVQARHAAQFPVLCDSQATDIEHSADTTLWHDALYVRDYRVLPKGKPGEWLRTRFAVKGDQPTIRVDVFVGLHPKPLASASLCTITLGRSHGELFFQQRQGAEDLPSAPWGILSVITQLPPGLAECELRIVGAGDTNLRVQRVEVRVVSSAL